MTDLTSDRFGADLQACAWLGNAQPWCGRLTASRHQFVLFVLNLDGWRLDVIKIRFGAGAAGTEFETMTAGEIGSVCRS
jgi:hypothetical protein